MTVEHKTPEKAPALKPARPYLGLWLLKHNTEPTCHGKWLSVGMRGTGVVIAWTDNPNLASCASQDDPGTLLSNKRRLEEMGHEVEFRLIGRDPFPPLTAQNVEDVIEAGYVCPECGSNEFSTDQRCLVPLSVKAGEWGSELSSPDFGQTEMVHCSICGTRLWSMDDDGVRILPTPLVEALEALLAYCTPSERSDYERTPSEHHVYHHITRLQDWLIRSHDVAEREETL